MSAEEHPQGDAEQTPIDASIESSTRVPKTEPIHTIEQADGEHPSDYPGRDYPDEDSLDRDRFTSKADRSHSSGLSSPSEPRRPGTGERQAPLREAPSMSAALPIVPGELILADEDVVINEGLEVTVLRVSNTADRPIQVGSHFHFFEVNAALDFDRDAAWGKRLNVLSGGAVRFEPGAVAEVELVPIRGRRIVRGLRGLCRGELDG